MAQTHWRERDSRDRRRFGETRGRDEYDEQRRRRRGAGGYRDDQADRDEQGRGDYEYEGQSGDWEQPASGGSWYGREDDRRDEDYRGGASTGYGRSGEREDYRSGRERDEGSRSSRRGYLGGYENEREGRDRSRGRSDSSYPTWAEDWQEQPGEGDEGGYYRGYYRRSTMPYRFEGGSGSILTESWMISGPYAGKGPKGYRRSNEQITEEASQRLYRHGRVDASDIDVSCEDGVLTLKGTVRDRQTKRMAEECVESIFGVDDVVNELRVRRESSQPQAQSQGREEHGETRAQQGRKNK